MGKTKTYEASLYGHGSCNRVMMIAGLSGTEDGG